MDGVKDLEKKMRNYLRYICDDDIQFLVDREACCCTAINPARRTL